MSMRCASLKKREERVGKDSIEVTCALVWQKHSRNANLVTDQENTERSGKCVWFSLTVAKHQGPYAQKQHDRHWSPQTTGHAHLHILIGFARTCVRQRTNKLSTVTVDDCTVPATYCTVPIICLATRECRYTVLYQLSTAQLPSCIPTTVLSNP